MIIECKNLTKSFSSGDSSNLVISNINLTVANSEFVTINGPSGSGKTTLLNILGLLDDADSGELIINGNLVANRNRVKFCRASTIGFLFQNHYLIPQLTLFENVLLATQVIKQEIQKDEILSVFESMNLVDIADSYPHHVSGGECQRAAFIRSIINKPKIVIADEPTGNLDFINTKLLIDIILKYNNDHNVAFLVATHDNCITKVSNKRLYIENSKLLKSKD